jgi:hypothetical protein
MNNAEQRLLEALKGYIREEIDDKFDSIDVSSMVADAVDSALQKELSDGIQGVVIDEIRSNTCKGWIEEIAVKAVAKQLMGGLI